MKDILAFTIYQFRGIHCGMHTCHGRLTFALDVSQVKSIFLRPVSNCLGILLYKYVY